MASLHFHDVTLGYDRHPAVHHLSGEVASGALLAVVGPNGAGKSTLFRGVVGLLKPLAGTIVIRGGKARDIADTGGSPPLWLLWHGVPDRVTACARSHASSTPIMHNSAGM